MTPSCVKRPGGPGRSCVCAGHAVGGRWSGSGAGGIGKQGRLPDFSPE